MYKLTMLPATRATIYYVRSNFLCRLMDGIKVM